MSAAVRRRHVLFFGGFDPKGAAWYHGIYKRHAALQSAVNGMQIEVGPRQRDAAGRQSWTVRSSTAGQPPCESRVEVIAWDATVRRHWPRRGWRMLFDMLGAYARMLRHGIPQLVKVGRIAPRTLFALLYPLLFFAGGAAIVLALAALGAALARALGAGLPLAACAAVLVLWAGGVVLARIERWLDTGLLARIFAFVTTYAVHGLPELERIIDAARGRIEELARDPGIDELLVVGYSVGTILATRACARAGAALGAAPAGAPRLALLTLGNCIPLLGLFPQAAAYRRELAALAASDRLTWVDVSAPTDWGSFALLDPLEVCEAGPERRGAGAPQMTSPRFHTLFEPGDYAAMIGNKHRMHTQYLMSTQKPGRYDYFAITAGPLALAERYAARRAREPRA